MTYFTSPHKWKVCRGGPALFANGKNLPARAGKSGNGGGSARRSAKGSGDAIFGAPAKKREKMNFVLDKITEFLRVAIVTKYLNNIECNVR